MGRGTTACHMRHTVAAQGTHVDTVKQMFPGAEQNGREDEVQRNETPCRPPS